jgi:hypothetical protein
MEERRNAQIRRMCLISPHIVNTTPIAAAYDVYDRRLFGARRAPLQKTAPIIYAIGEYRQVACDRIRVFARTTGG